ncbi:unnamed protein product, partial [Gongylonema pulchrum]|uniref:Cytochrome b5 heme-binding domain-containing protein n=1 Tax=Gongylonema pulchrum TaxID=637853 RepID=A0A183DF03_9BILA
PFAFSSRSENDSPSRISSAQTRARNGKCVSRRFRQFWMHAAEQSIPTLRFSHTCVRSGLGKPRKFHTMANGPKVGGRGPAPNHLKRWCRLSQYGAVLLVGGGLLLKYRARTARAADASDQEGGGFIVKIEKRSDLPTYRIDEVKKHGKNAERIWVTCQGGVYDVTDFVEGHPGGNKILLAAGSSIDPYWNIYQQHRTPETVELLEEMRIGNLDERDIVVEELKVVLTE